MISKPLVAAFLAAGCVGAAAAGAFVAVRQSPQEPAGPPAPIESAAVAARPVAETEAVITPPAAPTTAAATAPAPDVPVEAPSARAARPAKSPQEALKPRTTGRTA